MSAQQQARPAIRSVCLGVSGSVAAVKTPALAQALLAAGMSVEVVVSEAAVKLMQATYRGEQPWRELLALAERTAAGGSEEASLRIWRDQDEWDAYGCVGSDPVLHVELAKRNSLLLIAPLCANTLASVALGLFRDPQNKRTSIRSLPFPRHWPRSNVP